MMSQVSKPSSTSSRSPLGTRTHNGHMLDPSSLKIKVKKKTGEYFLQYKVQDLRLQGKRSTAIDANQETLSFTSMVKGFEDPNLMDLKLRLINCTASQDLFRKGLSKLNTLPPPPISK